MKKNVTIILNMLLHKMKKNIMYIYLGSKITADDDCSHEIKKHLLLGRKVMTNLDSIFKSRDITLQQRFVSSRLWLFLWSCMDVRVGL